MLLDIKNISEEKEVKDFVVQLDYNKIDIRNLTYKVDSIPDNYSLIGIREYKEYS